MPPRPPRPTLFPYTTLFRSRAAQQRAELSAHAGEVEPEVGHLVAIDHDARFGQIDLQVGVDVQELRSEEHTSELQSHSDLVCRLLLEKKKKKYKNKHEKHIH